MLAQLKLEPKRIIGVLLGNLLLGIGIGIFKYSNMGNDPFSAMVLSLYERFDLSYAVFLILLNCLIFVAEILFGRKYIGVGTFINWFLLGYVVQYSIAFFENILPTPENFFYQIVAVAVGVLIAGFGLSMYQRANAGVAPYDSLALILTDHLKIPYFWSRILFDSICALIAFVAGGLIGLGTLTCAFGLGPVASFFNKRVSKKEV